MAGRSCNILNNFISIFSEGQVLRDAIDALSFLMLQVFINTSCLEKLMAIRVKYMLVVCKEAPSSVPELVLCTSANNKEMLCKLHDAAMPGSDTLKYLVQFDSLQTSSTWVQSWSEVLTCDSVEEVVVKIEQQIGTSPSSLGSFASLRSSEKAKDEKNEKHEKLEKEASEPDAEAERGDHVGCEKTDTTISSVMSLEELHKYRDQQCILDCAPKNFFEDSVEAKALGLERFCASSMVQFQKKLEAAVWEFFQDLSRGDDHILVDFRAAKKDAVTVKLPAPTPTTMALPFVGPLSTTKTPKNIKFCTVFGVDFYINPCGEDLQTAEVLVPAWYCRPVTKADQAYFAVSTVTVGVTLKASTSSLASVSVLSFAPPEADRAGDDCKYCKLECSIQMLNPLADINHKLEADLKKNKEKAEKSTRNCINSSVKQAQKAAAAKKKTNKRKRGAEEAGAEGENADPNGGGENAAVDWAARLQKAEEDQLKIDALVNEAVNACKKPSAIPITRLCSDSERVQNSSRAMLLQSVLREKQDAEKKAAAEVVKTHAAAALPGKLGAMAAVQAFERDGVLGGKGKKKAKAGGENSAAAAAENVMKLGKHVLK